MASTAITGADATDSADEIDGPDVITCPAATGGLDAPRPGPGTVVPSPFAGRRSWPSDAVLSGSPVGAPGDESSCSVSFSEKCQPRVPVQERGVGPLSRRRGARAGRNTPNPIRRHGG